MTLKKVGNGITIPTDELIFFRGVETTNQVAWSGVEWGVLHPCDSSSEGYLTTKVGRSDPRQWIWIKVLGDQQTVRWCRIWVKETSGSNGTGNHQIGRCQPMGYGKRTMTTMGSYRLCDRLLIKLCCFKGCGHFTTRTIRHWTWTRPGMSVDTMSPRAQPLRDSMDLNGLSQHCHVLHALLPGPNATTFNTGCGWNFPTSSSREDLVT